MKFIIKHESRGRLRVQLCQSRMTLAQADLLQAWLHAQPHVLQADVHERTCCAVVTFRGDCREQLLSSLRSCADTATFFQLCRTAEQTILDEAQFLPIFYKNQYLVTQTSNTDLHYDAFSGAIDFRNAKHFE